jgi:hypothetical protein
LGPLCHLNLLPLVQTNTSELIIFTNGSSGPSARQEQTTGSLGPPPERSAGGPLDPFFNTNRPEDLEEAAGYLE